MNEEIKTIRVHCMSRVISPLTHNSGTSGNETIVHQEPVYHGGQVKMVPVISGNALRHRCVREPGAMHLIKALGLYGSCTVDMLNYLFNGGSLTKSGTTDNMKVIAKMQRLLPLIRLLGGCLPNQIINGSLICKRGILVCEENRSQIDAQIPPDFGVIDAPLKGAQEFIGKYQYTRGDAEKHKDFSRMAGDEQGERDSSLMIYSGQTIVPGALFYHGFILQNVSILELGALVFSLEQWSISGGTIGGSQRVGHGQIETSVMIENHEDTWPPQDAAAAYLDHTEDTKIEAATFLAEVFADKKMQEKIKEKIEG